MQKTVSLQKFLVVMGVLCAFMFTFVLFATNSHSVQGADCNVTFTVTQQWNSGGSFDVEVTGVASIQTLEWDFWGTESISALYSGTLSQTGKHVTITNPDNSFGGQLSSSTWVANPQNFIVNGQACGGGDPAPTPTLAVSPGTIAYEIDMNSERRPISPYIYGLNPWWRTGDGAVTPWLTETEGLGSARFGGNRTTAYNWEIDGSNAGHDYYYVSDAWYCFITGATDTACDAGNGATVKAFHDKKPRTQHSLHARYVANGWVCGGGQIRSATRKCSQ